MSCWFAIVKHSFMPAAISIDKFTLSIDYIIAKITLKLANGIESTFPLKLLSKESIARAKGYAK